MFLHILLLNGLIILVIYSFHFPLHFTPVGLFFWSWKLQTEINTFVCFWEQSFPAFKVFFLCKFQEKENLDITVGLTTALCSSGQNIHFLANNRIWFYETIFLSGWEYYISMHSECSGWKNINTLYWDYFRWQITALHCASLHRTTLYTVLCTLYTVHCILYTVHCSL